MKAVIYTRFSPRRNAEESQSCETQYAQCLEFAKDMGWEVHPDMFEDRDLSGSDADRPGLQMAVATLKRGDILLVYNRDRLARDVLIAELTRRQVAAVGASIVAVSGDIAGDDKDPTVIFVRQIMDAVAELARKQTAIKTRDSMRQLQRKGRRMGRFPPYGTRFDEADPNKLVPVPEERVAVVRVKELADKGVGVQGIVRALNAELRYLARGKLWRRNTVLKIMDRVSMD